MKLNLLPTHVSKGSQTRGAVLLAVIIAASSFVLAFFLITSSESALNAEKKRVAEKMPIVDQAVQISKQADTVIAQSRGVILNINLAEAMLVHNAKYPQLYDDVKAYVPSFFRLRSMSAVPATPDTSTVTITGVIKTYQEYSDLMLALLRVPGAIAVNRAGYVVNEPFLPAVTENQQRPKPLKPGEQPLPEDPLARLDARIEAARGKTGMELDNAGGFGTLDAKTTERGAMPQWSEITVTLTIARGLMTPDPRATLNAAAALWGGAPAPNAGGGGGAPGPGGGNGGGGRPPAPSGPGGGNDSAAADDAS